MNIIKNEVNLGLEKPFKILHISDCHLTLSDQRDNERKHKLSNERFDEFKHNSTMDYINPFLDYSKKNCSLTVCTGDIIDFVSEKNCEMLKEICFQDNFLFAVGNHEFSLYVGEAEEDLNYKMQSFNKIQNSVPHNINFHAEVINGVNFITLDNSYYNFNLRQLMMLKVECEKEYPIVLCMHTPIYEEKQFDKLQNGDKSKVTYLCGCPDEKISGYSTDRFNQQKTDDITKEFIDYIHSTDKIKLILSGHCHDDFNMKFENGLIQYVTGGTFMNSAREITLY